MQKRTFSEASTGHSCNSVSHLGWSSIAVQIAAKEALVLSSAREHFLTKVFRLECSGLNALDVSLESGFEGCCREMANGRMPLHLPETMGNLVQALYTRKSRMSSIIPHRHRLPQRVQ